MSSFLTRLRQISVKSIAEPAAVSALVYLGSPSIVPDIAGTTVVTRIPGMPDTVSGAVALAIAAGAGVAGGNILTPMVDGALRSFNVIRADNSMVRTFLPPVVAGVTATLILNFAFDGFRMDTTEMVYFAGGVGIGVLAANAMTDAFLTA